MGCSRPNTIEVSELPVDNKPTDVAYVPQSASEGQMDFLNVGATTITIRFRQIASSNQVSGTLYSIKLAAGNGYTQNGIIPGGIIAWSDANGGKLSTFIAYR